MDLRQADPPLGSLRLGAEQFDPNDTNSISRRLESRLGLHVIEGPERLHGGLDTYVYSFRLGGAGVAREWAGPLILRVYPDAAQAGKAEREARVQTFVSDRGFAAPRPLLVETSLEPLGLPFMIMERFDGRPMLDRFKNPLAVPGLLRTLAGLHVRLHRLPVHDFPTPDDRPLVDRLLSNARDELPLDAAAEMRAALSWLESNAGVVRQEVGVLCHNDFHPLNVLLSREGKACLIDWSDADIGDRHCDVGRTTALFWLAPPLARSPVERLVLRAFRRYFIAAYLGRYSREMEVETPRLQFWQTLHALRAWAQLDKLQSTGKATLGARRGAAGEVPPGLVPALREYLRDRVSPR